MLFIIKLYIFTKNIANGVEKWFYTLNFDQDDKTPLPIGKNKINGLFKDKLGGKIMKEFVGLRQKTRTCLMDADSEHKKGKGTKKCVIKRGLMFKNYADCLLNNKIILKSQQRFKCDYHIIHALNKSIKLRKLHRIHLEQTFSKYAKVR